VTWAKNMGKKKFTRQQLYCLRNEIPIDILIENLEMPFRIEEGRFRFRCPLCGEFNTAVNPETNLARCFRCGKNFNTIDLVMLIRKVDFVTAIGYLKALLENNQTKCDPQEPNTNRSENQPTHIGNILESIAPVHMAEPPRSRQSVHARIEALEQKVELLTRQMVSITQSLE